VKFVPASHVLSEAVAARDREARRLREIGIHAELVLTGGSSLPGALTGGDIDLHLRVEPTQFEAVTRRMRETHVVVHPEIWSRSLATFAAPDDPRVGIAVTPIDSEHDRRFRGAWDRLRSDRGALAAYNDMKRTAGDGRGYLAAKAEFFNSLERGPRSGPSRRDLALAAVPAAVALVGFLTAVAPQRAGVLALAQILLPHATIAAACIAALALVWRGPWVARATAALAAMALLRLGGEWVSFSPPAGVAAEPVNVVSWNLELDGNTAQDVVDALVARAPDIVGLQELTPRVARALRSDPDIAALFPHRVLRPEPGVAGMGLLSRYPLGGVTSLDDVAGFRTTVTFGSGHEVDLVNAHPYPGRITLLAGVPVAFDARERDEAIGRVRRAIDGVIDAGDRVIVLGDFNVAPTEPGYAELANGLRDVHAEVGFGPGWTWRPGRFEPMGIGLLRIDYVLVSDGLRPIASDVDCRSGRGDHCLLSAEVAIDDR
jgi:endonuclease/exonuclease/phosphatase (EEP) superfamily protein YafD